MIREAGVCGMVTRSGVIPAFIVGDEALIGIIAGVFAR
jgi:hypothetical protein